MPQINESNIAGKAVTQSGGGFSLGNVSDIIKQIKGIKDGMAELGIEIPGMAPRSAPAPDANHEVPPRKVIESTASPVKQESGLDSLEKGLALLCTLGKGKITLGEILDALRPITVEDALKQIRDYKKVLK